MSAAKTVVFETGHEDLIHDAQLDYYGKRLATASSDRSIRIFEVSGPNNERQLLLSTLKGHEGPVWQIAWAHPKFGSILSSASYDGRVVVWKETAANVWGKVFEDSKIDSSVNCLAFAPHALGLVLAVGRSDGTVSVFARKENNDWERAQYIAHKGGVNGISWAPNPISSSSKPSRFDGRFVTGGNDNKLRIWRFDAATNQWVDSAVFEGTAHTDWIRDVAWAPSMGLPHNTLASASEDKSVLIWTEDANGVWKSVKKLSFDSRVWRVSWSVMGNILAVAQGDNKVSLWKESLDGDWKNVSTVNETSNTQQTGADGKADL